jgi:hypothetical protein
VNNVFSFGERLDGYEVAVLNERVVRAGAGLLFLFAIAAFMNAWLTGNFQPTRVFVLLSSSTSPCGSSSIPATRPA